MNHSDTIILYHAYGVAALYDQVLFSILTLYYHLDGKFNNIKIVIYTDNTKYFDKYTAVIPIIFEPLDIDKIIAFKGELNFVHRVKVCVIKECLTKYKTNIFYLDSDTYFTASPVHLLQQINEQTSIMNSNDCDLHNADELYENLDWLLIRRAIRDYTYTVEGKEIRIPLETRMWNAGVLGISYDNVSLLDDVLSLTDQIYRNKKVFTAEQFAFSYYLQIKTKLITSGDVIFHYWPNFIGMYWKNWYSYHFKVFFNKHKHQDVEELAALAFELTRQHDKLMAPVKKTFFQKVILRIKQTASVAIKGR